MTKSIKASKIRLPIQITEETKKYLEFESQKLCISMSALINIAIAKYQKDNQQ